MRVHEAEAGQAAGLAPVPERPSVPAAGFARLLLWLVPTLLWLVAWYWPSASQVARIWWHSETYAHGLVVLPVFVWLLWDRRASLAQVRPEPAAWVLAPLALAGFLWLLGQIVSVNGLSHFALVSIIALSFAAVLGTRLAWQLAFPLLFLFFGVPIGDFLLPTLMDYTADFTVAALRLSGVPVFREGLYFTVPNGRWAVVEACSGIRYLIASVMVGTLYAYLNYRSAGRRILFVGVAIVVPIVANWLRAYFIVLLGYLTDNKLAAGVDHLIYGWVFFGVVILVMFWIGGRWREAPAAVAPAADEAVTADPMPPRRRALVLLALALCTAFFPLAWRQLDRPVAPFQMLLQAPPAAAGWQADGDSLHGYRPRFSGHRGEAFQAYRRADGRVVGVYVAYYAHQRSGSELVAWQNRLTGYEHDEWRVLSTARVNTPVGRVNRSLLADAALRLGVWHWYWTNGRVVDSDYRAKLVLAMDHLTGEPDDAAFVALYTDVDEHPEDARELIESFMQAHRDGIDAMLAGARRQP